MEGFKEIYCNFAPVGCDTQHCFGKLQFEIASLDVSEFRSQVVKLDSKPN